MGLLLPSKSSFLLLGLAIAIHLVIPSTNAAPFESNEKASRGKGCYFMQRYYNSGETIETGEKCLNCTCRENTLMCYLRICPFVKPLGEDCIEEHLPNECCPKFWCPEVYPRVSTEKPEDDETGCYIDGKYYQEGARIPSNPLRACEACYCIRNSSVCTVQQCELKVEGCSPQYKQGSCCPSRYNCTKFAATTLPPGILEELDDKEGCILDGKKYADGEQVESEDKCKHCYCMKHEVVCAVEDCKAPGDGCVAVPSQDGQCCPERYECPSTATPTLLPTTEIALQDAVISTKSTAIDESSVKSVSVVSKEAKKAPEPTVPKLVISQETSGTTQKTVTTIMEVSQTVMSQGPRIPKITEHPVGSTKVARNVTRRPVIIIGQIPGEGNCRHLNLTYVNGQVVPSNDPCRTNCSCSSSVIQCDAVECTLIRPPGFASCKSMRNKDECCPRFECYAESHSAVDGIKQTQFDATITTTRVSIAEDTILEQTQFPLTEQLDFGDISSTTAAEVKIKFTTTGMITTTISIPDTKESSTHMSIPISEVMQKQEVETENALINETTTVERTSMTATSSIPSEITTVKFKDTDTEIQTTTEAIVKETIASDTTEGVNLLMTTTFETTKATEVSVPPVDEITPKETEKIQVSVADTKFTTEMSTISSVSVETTQSAVNETHVADVTEISTMISQTSTPKFASETTTMTEKENTEMLHDETEPLISISSTVSSKDSLSTKTEPKTTIGSTVTEDLTIKETSTPTTTESIIREPTTLPASSGENISSETVPLLTDIATTSIMEDKTIKETTETTLFLTSTVVTAKDKITITEKTNLTSMEDLTAIPATEEGTMTQSSVQTKSSFETTKITESLASATDVVRDNMASETEITLSTTNVFEKTESTTIATSEETMMKDQFGEKSSDRIPTPTPFSTTKSPTVIEISTTEMPVRNISIILTTKSTEEANGTSVEKQEKPITEIKSASSETTLSSFTSIKLGEISNETLTPSVTTSAETIPVFKIKSSTELLTEKDTTTAPSIEISTTKTIASLSIHEENATVAEEPPLSTTFAPKINTEDVTLADDTKPTTAVVDENVTLSETKKMQTESKEVGLKKTTLLEQTSTEKIILTEQISTEKTTLPETISTKTTAFIEQASTKGITSTEQISTKTTAFTEQTVTEKTTLLEQISTGKDTLPKQSFTEKIPEKTSATISTIQDHSVIEKTSPAEQVPEKKSTFSESKPTTIISDETSELSTRKSTTSTHLVDITEDKTNIEEDLTTKIVELPKLGTTLTSETTNFTELPQTKTSEGILLSDKPIVEVADISVNLITFTTPKATSPTEEIFSDVTLKLTTTEKISSDSITTTQTTVEEQETTTGTTSPVITQESVTTEKVTTSTKDSGTTATTKSVIVPSQSFELQSDGPKTSITDPKDQGKTELTSKTTPHQSLTTTYSALDEIEISTFSTIPATDSKVTSGPEFKANVTDTFTTRVTDTETFLEKEIHSSRQEETTVSSTIDIISTKFIRSSLSDEVTSEGFEEILTTNISEKSSVTEFPKKSTTAVVSDDITEASTFRDRIVTNIPSEIIRNISEGISMANTVEGSITTALSKELSTIDTSKEITISESSKESTITESSIGSMITDSSKESTTADSVKEIITIDALKESVTTNIPKENVTTDISKENVTADRKKENVTADRKKESLATDTSKENVDTDISKENVPTDTPKESISTDVFSESEPTDFDKESVTTDIRKEDVVTDITKESADTDISKGSVPTDTPKERLATDISKETVPTDTPKESVATDISSESVAADVSSESETTDFDKESVTTDIAEEHVATDISKESVDTDISKGSVPTDTPKGSVATNTPKGSVATNTPKESVATDVSIESKITDFDKESVTTDIIKENVTTDISKENINVDISKEKMTTVIFKEISVADSFAETSVVDSFAETSMADSFAETSMADNSSVETTQSSQPPIGSHKMPSSEVSEWQIKEELTTMKGKEDEQGSKSTRPVEGMFDVTTRKTPFSPELIVSAIESDKEGSTVLQSSVTTSGDTVRPDTVTSPSSLIKATVNPTISDDQVITITLAAMTEETSHLKSNESIEDMTTVTSDLETSTFEPQISTMFHIGNKLPTQFPSRSHILTTFMESDEIKSAPSSISTFEHLSTTKKELETKKFTLSPTTRMIDLNNFTVEQISTSSRNFSDSSADISQTVTLTSLQLETEVFTNPKGDATSIANPTVQTLITSEDSTQSTRQKMLSTIKTTVQVEEDETTSTLPHSSTKVTESNMDLGPFETPESKTFVSSTLSSEESSSKIFQTTFIKPETISKIFEETTEDVEKTSSSSEETMGKQTETTITERLISTETITIPSSEKNMTGFTKIIETEKLTDKSFTTDSIILSDERNLSESTTPAVIKITELEENTGIEEIASKPPSSLATESKLTSVNEFVTTDAVESHTKVKTEVSSSTLPVENWTTQPTSLQTIKETELITLRDQEEITETSLETERSTDISTTNTFVSSVTITSGPTKRQTSEMMFNEFETETPSILEAKEAATKTLGTKHTIRTTTQIPTTTTELLVKKLANTTQMQTKQTMNLATINDELSTEKTSESLEIKTSALIEDYTKIPTIPTLKEIETTSSETIKISEETLKPKTSVTTETNVKVEVLETSETTSKPQIFNLEDKITKHEILETSEGTTKTVTLPTTIETSTSQMTETTPVGERVEVVTGTKVPTTEILAAVVEKQNVSENKDTEVKLSTSSKSTPVITSTEFNEQTTIHITEEPLIVTSQITELFTPVGEQSAATLEGDLVNETDDEITGTVLESTSLMFSEKIHWFENETEIELQTENITTAFEIKESAAASTENPKTLLADFTTEKEHVSRSTLLDDHKKITDKLTITPEVDQTTGTSLVYEESDETKEKIQISTTDESNDLMKTTTEFFQNPPEEIDISTTPREIKLPTTHTNDATTEKTKISANEFSTTEAKPEKEEPFTAITTEKTADTSKLNMQTTLSSEQTTKLKTTKLLPITSEQKVSTTVIFGQTEDITMPSKSLTTSTTDIKHTTEEEFDHVSDIKNFTILQSTTTEDGIKTESITSFATTKEPFSEKFITTSETSTQKGIETKIVGTSEKPNMTSSVMIETEKDTTVKFLETETTSQPKLISSTEIHLDSETVSEIKEVSEISDITKLITINQETTKDGSKVFTSPTLMFNETSSSSTESPKPHSETTLVDISTKIKDFGMSTHLLTGTEANSEFSASTVTTSIPTKMGTSTLAFPETETPKTTENASDITEMKPIVTTLQSQKNEVISTPVSFTTLAEAIISTTETKDCIVGDELYADGEKIVTINPCEACHCALGAVTCWRQLCKAPSHGCIARPGQEDKCCPIAFDCPIEKSDPEKSSTEMEADAAAGVVEENISTKTTDSSDFVTTETSSHLDETKFTTPFSSKLDFTSKHPHETDATSSIQIKSETFSSTQKVDSSSFDETRFDTSTLDVRKIQTESTTNLITNLGHVSTVKTPSSVTDGEELKTQSVNELLNTNIKDMDLNSQTTTVFSPKEPLTQTTNFDEITKHQVITEKPVTGPQRLISLSKVAESSLKNGTTFSDQADLSKQSTQTVAFDRSTTEFQTDSIASEVSDFETTLKPKPIKPEDAVFAFVTTTHKPRRKPTTTSPGIKISAESGKEDESMTTILLKDNELTEITTESRMSSMIPLDKITTKIDIQVNETTASTGIETSVTYLGVQTDNVTTEEISSPSSISTGKPQKSENVSSMSTSENASLIQDTTTMLPPAADTNLTTVKLASSSFLTEESTKPPSDEFTTNLLSTEKRTEMTGESNISEIVKITEGEIETFSRKATTAVKMPIITEITKISTTETITETPLIKSTERFLETSSEQSEWQTTGKLKAATTEMIPGLRTETQSKVPETLPTQKPTGILQTLSMEEITEVIPKNQTDKIFEGHLTVDEKSSKPSTAEIIKDSTEISLPETTLATTTVSAGDTITKIIEKETTKKEIHISGLPPTEISDILSTIKLTEMSDSHPTLKTTETSETDSTIQSTKNSHTFTTEKVREISDTFSIEKAKEKTSIISTTETSENSKSPTINATAKSEEMHLSEKVTNTPEIFSTEKAVKILNESLMKQVDESREISSSVQTTMSLEILSTMKPTRTSESTSTDNIFELSTSEKTVDRTRDEFPTKISEDISNDSTIESETGTTGFSFEISGETSKAPLITTTKAILKTTSEADLSTLTFNEMTQKLTEESSATPTKLSSIVSTEKSFTEPISPQTETEIFPQNDVTDVQEITPTEKESTTPKEVPTKIVTRLSSKESVPQEISKKVGSTSEETTTEISTPSRIEVSEKAETSNNEMKPTTTEDIVEISEEFFGDEAIKRPQTVSTTETKESPTSTSKELLKIGAETSTKFKTPVQHIGTTVIETFAENQPSKMQTVIETSSTKFPTTEPSDELITEKATATITTNVPSMSSIKPEVELTHTDGEMISLSTTLSDENTAKFMASTDDSMKHVISETVITISTMNDLDEKLKSTTSERVVEDIFNETSVVADMTTTKVPVTTAQKEGEVYQTVTTDEIQDPKLQTSTLFSEKELTSTKAETSSVTVTVDNEEKLWRNLIKETEDHKTVTTEKIHEETLLTEKFTLSKTEMQEENMSTIESIKTGETGSAGKQKLTTQQSVTFDTTSAIENTESSSTLVPISEVLGASEISSKTDVENLDTLVTKSDLKTEFSGEPSEDFTDFTKLIPETLDFETRLPNITNLTEQKTPLNTSVSGSFTEVDKISHTTSEVKSKTETFTKTTTTTMPKSETPDSVEDSSVMDTNFTLEGIASTMFPEIAIESKSTLLPDIVLRKLTPSTEGLNINQFGTVTSTGTSNPITSTQKENQTATDMKPGETILGLFKMSSTKDQEFKTTPSKSQRAEPIAEAFAQSSQFITSSTAMGMTSSTPRSIAPSEMVANDQPKISSEKLSTQSAPTTFDSETFSTTNNLTTETPPDRWTTSLPTKEHSSLNDTEATTVTDEFFLDEGACIFQGVIYHSAQQIPRPDACEFCFCFRSDVICLQQSCPPPVDGCHRTPIPGYCCPRFECPIYVTSKNMTRTSQRFGNRQTVYIQRRDKREVSTQVEVTGCNVKGSFYEIGHTVKSASGPCLHCQCNLDGIMRCDPRKCKPETPLLLKLNPNFFRRR